jgi:hypothetical protein
MAEERQHVVLKQIFGLSKAGTTGFPTQAGAVRGRAEA